MKEPAYLTEKNSFIKISNPIRTTVFFVLFFLYLWLKVDLRFIIHCGGIVKNIPVFYLGWDFLQEHLTYPGKPVAYLTAFLAQLWQIGWLGALIATIVAWLIFVCTDTIIRLINAPYIRFVRFAGPLLLLSIYTRYTYHFDTAISLLVALSFVVLYLKIIQKQKKSGLIVFLVLSTVVYYLGGKSYSLFAVVCCIYEWFFNRRGKTGLLYLLLAVAVPYIVEGLILGIGTHDTFIKHLPLPLSSPARMLIVAYMLYFMVPLVLLGLGLCRIIKAKLFPNITSFSIGPRPVTAISSEVIKTIILFIIAALSIYLFSRDPRALIIKADYYACRRKWPEVIRTIRLYPRNSSNINMLNRASSMLNRALYHTGRLGFDMFTFPQNTSTLFLNIPSTTELTKSVPGFWQNFGIYLDLGYMNYAQNSLWNALDLFGEQPVLLKELAIVNMVKGNYPASRVHLYALSKTLFHADWAKKYLARLKSDPTLERDDQIQRLRRVMLTQDYGFRRSGPDRVMLNLLETNKKNRMAFEYLMATYLLQRQQGLVYFIHNLHRLKDFNYPKIPRLYEEAIIVYMTETLESVDLPGYQISPESIRRYKQFVQSAQRYQNILQENTEPYDDTITNRLQAAREHTADNFGDSYMFYYYSENQEQKNEVRLEQDNALAYTELADNYRQLKQYDNRCILPTELMLL